MPAITPGHDIKPEAVPGEFSRSLLARARASGLDVPALLEAARVPLAARGDDLRLESLSPEQYSRLCLELVRGLGDESGGLMPDMATPPGTIRMIALSMLSCPSLGVAMRRAIEFNACCRLQGRAAVVNELLVDSGTREATLTYVYGDDSEAGPYRILCNLAMWLRYCGWLIGQQIDITRAVCCGGQPASTVELRHFFHCPVEYGGEVNSVTFSARHLDAEMVRDEAQLAGFLRLAPYHIVVQPLASGLSITHRIMAILGDDFRMELPSFEELTGLLNMSARTLRRRLEREGTSYQRIKDNARRDVAIELLGRQGVTVSEVAELVGFSDPSAFHRSFKKWTGQSPGSYR